MRPPSKIFYIRIITNFDSLCNEKSAKIRGRADCGSTGKISGTFG